MQISLIRAQLNNFNDLRCFEDIQRKFFFRREVGGPLLERAVFNYSCHCYPTKTPDSCQVDESRNSMKTTRARKRFQTRV